MRVKAFELEEKLRVEGKMIVEKWYVQTCETKIAYEVLMLKSKNGTDIMVKEIGLAKIINSDYASLMRSRKS